MSFRSGRSVLAPALLALACCLPGAELGWSGAPGAKPPPGWSLAAAAGAQIEFLERALEISALSGQRALAVAACAVGDGSDERPLRLSAAITVAGERVVRGYPALLALEWAGGGCFAVGIGAEPTSGEGRRTWAVWGGAGRPGSASGSQEMAPDGCPSHVRIILTSRQIAAFGSRDGWSWSLITAVPRERLGASGAPARVLVGRGQPKDGAPGLAADPPGDASGKPCRYRFADLAIDSGSNEVPTALLRTYAKQESLADTLNAFLGDRRPRQWRLRGPEDPGTVLPEMLPADFASTGTWKDYALAANDRIIPLGQQLPDGNRLRWAATEVTVAQPGQVRFRFDGMPICRLYVDGRLLASMPYLVGKPDTERYAAAVWLSAGTHRVVLATVGEAWIGSIALSWERVDPQQRIALLRRLAIDFTGDEQLAEAPFELATLWEGLGFPRQAAEELAPLVAADPETAQSALAERIRLLHQAGDTAAVEAGMVALRRLWQDSGFDAVVTARRSARLWQRLDDPTQAAAVLAEAVKLPGLDARTRCSLAMDRARLGRALGDQPGTVAALRTAAGMLPVGDGVRFELLCTAALLDPATPAVALAELATQVTDQLRARLLGSVHQLRKDEAARLAVRRAGAALPGPALAPLTVELAEERAAAGDQAEALKLYQSELARRGLPAAADLAQARITLVRGTLAATPAGAALLAEADRVPAAEVRPQVWQLRGPLPLGDWTPFDKPPFDPAKPPSGAEWRLVDTWRGGLLDLMRYNGADNVVWYLATTIHAEAAGPMPAGFGADDALGVWLNGERIYSDRQQRGCVPDSIKLELKLRQGDNQLLCAVQNGSGAGSLHCRLNRNVRKEAALAAAIAGAGSDRSDAAATLLAMTNEALTAGRPELAWALGRTIIVCWPEQTNPVIDVSTRAISQWNWMLTPTSRVELIAWFDQALADSLRDNPWWRGWLQDNAPGQLMDADQVDEALARIARSALTELSPEGVAKAYLREADALLRLGLSDRAGAAAQRAIDAAPDDPAILREAGRRRDLVRHRKGGRLIVAENLEANARLRIADRAMAEDPARATKDLQLVIEGAADLPVRLADGRLRGLALFAAARLRSAGEPVRQAWLEQQAGRAEEALRRLAGDEPQALSTLTARWPLAPAAVEARRREADLWAARGAWQLAAGTAQRGLAEQPGADQRHLLLRAAQASARLGDGAGLATLLARMGKLGGTWPWDARQLSADGLATALRALLPPAPAAAVPARAGLIVRLPPQILAMRPETVADARPPLPAAVLTAAGLIVATPDDLACVAEDGAVRWTLAPSWAGPAPRPPALPATGAAVLAVEGGIAIASLRSDGGRRLVAVDAASGRRLWSSGEVPGLAAASVASAPLLACGRLWAWFIHAEGSFVACLEARDGTVLWRSRLGLGLQRQPISGTYDRIAGGDAAAPVLDGRELFVATDAGMVGSFDAVDGTLRWLHAYARSTLDLQDQPQGQRRLLARGRGTLLLDAERLYLAPRDAIGILALDRAGGGVAWSNELADVHELVALAAEGVVALGPAITLHDRATGAARWRWRPASGERPGRPALDDGALWVPLRHGPLRLALADGAIRQGPAWAALGLAEPASGLLAAGGRLLALADGLVALPVPGTSAPVEAVVAQPTAPEARVAVAAAATTLATQWELPLGRVQRLFDAGNGEVYAVAAGRLHRVEAATGRIAWSAAAPSGEIRVISCEGPALCLRLDTFTTLIDRASGRQLAAVPLRRDPLVMFTWGDQWRWQMQPAGTGMLQWLYYDRQFALLDPVDSQPRWRASTVQNLWGAMVSGEELHLLTVRDGKAVMEVHRLADGALLKEVPLGPEGLDHGWLLPRPDGGGIVVTKNGLVLWDPAKASGIRLDVALEGIHRMTVDDGILNILGNGDATRVALVAADGRLLAKEDCAGNSYLAGSFRQAPRIVAGRRVQWLARENTWGALIRALDGTEQAWLPILGEAWRQVPLGVVPFGGRAIVLFTNQDGLLHLLLVDPAAGKVLGETTVAAALVEEVTPVVHAGGVVLATNRGLLRLVPASAARPPPGRAFAETPLGVWKMASPPVLDGDLAEWAGQQGWDQPASETGRGALPGTPLLAWAAWRDEGLVLAVHAALPPWRLPDAIVALEASREAFNGEVQPLLLRLSWLGGRGGCEVLHSPTSEDAARAPVRARVASGGTTMAWEVVVPWPWLYPSGEKPGQGAWLRFAAAFANPDRSGALELGTALAGGLDKSGMAQLQLLEVRPPVDPKAAQPAIEPPKPPVRR